MKNKHQKLFILLIALAVYALLLFVFDAAQRRLDLFREPEKAKENAERRPEEKKPEKPARAKTKKAREEDSGPSAADALWENLQGRKKL